MKRLFDRIAFSRLTAHANGRPVYDHSGRFPHPGGRQRTPLVAAISKDGGKTWPHRKLIEDDPDGWFCYTAIEFVDDSVLLGYCAGNLKDKSIGGLNRTRIRKIGLDWLVKD